MTFLEQDNPVGSLGSLEGEGAGDHDEPYHFGPTSRASRLASGAPGRRPRASTPYPFNTRQYARLFVFRSRVQSWPAVEDDAIAA